MTSEEERNNMVRLVANELKTARRNGKLDDSQLVLAGGLLGVQAPADWVFDRLSSLAGDDVRYSALYRALVRVKNSQSDDLTSRRQQFSSEHDISPRTAARYEDIAIRGLAERIVDEAIKQKKAMASAAPSAQEDIAPEADSVADSLPALLERIDDMSSREAVDAQRHMTERLGALLDRLAEQDQVIAKHQAARENTATQIEELNAAISRLQERVAAQIR